MIVFYFKTHAMFGAGISIFLLQYFNFTPMQSIIILIGVLIGSVLPDGDHPHSPAGLLFPLWLFWDHRTWSHSIWFVCPLAAITTGFYIDGSKWYLFFLGITIGTITHIFSDSFTKSGVKLFYGLSDRKIGFRCFKSSGKYDNAVFNLVGTAFIYMRFFK